MFNVGMIGEIQKAMKNPQAYAMGMLQKNPSLQNNPMIKNALEMTQNGNIKGVEQIARNMAKSNGFDLSMFGIK